MRSKSSARVRTRLVAGVVGLLAACLPASTASTALAQESTPPPEGTSQGPARTERARPELRLAPVGGGVAAVDLSFESSRLFASPSGSNIVVPDTMGAVGPDHIVELINGNMEVFDKETGASLEDRTLNSFWTDRVGVGDPSSGRFFDPRVVYDLATQRWFALAIDDAAPAGTSNSLYVGRSDTADPTGDWDGFRIDADVVAPEEFHDYPTLGIDAVGLYSCTQDFNGPGNESCYSFPKADLLLDPPSAANLTRFEATPAGLQNVSGAYQPAVDFGPDDGRAPLLGATGAVLTRTNVLGAGGAGATLSAPIAIAGDPGHAAPPDARQPLDSMGELHRIENVAPRFVANVFEQGDSLWAVHSVQGTGGNAALRWYRINETTNAVIQTGLIEDTNRDFIDPSIAVNAHGDVVIGYTCSGPSLAASACVSLGTTSGNVTTFQAPEILTTGAGIYFQDGGTDRNRWGDYSATVIDPVQPCTFWTFQEYVAVGGSGDIGPDDPTEVASGRWGIRTVEILFEQCLADAGFRDFGDAPATYGTTLAANGARHILDVAAPTLGAEVDVETDGLPTADSTGDDADATDDEDGVTIPPNLIAGFPNVVPVTASAAGGRLDAFVDLNGNGTFTDPGEKVVNSVLLAAGANNVVINIPAGASLGVSAARFRISAAGGLGPLGEAPNGEVEDYRVTIAGPEAICELSSWPGAIVGTNGANALVGTAGNDVILGLGGADDIRGLGGNDVLCGGDGDDWLQGGDGNDVLVGGANVDRIDGGAGDDKLFGRAGNDRLDGGTGTNTNDGGPDVDLCLNPGPAGSLNCP